MKRYPYPKYTRQLKNIFDITVFYYNPNIFPFEEYIRRRDEVIRFCSDKSTDLKILEEPVEVFYNFILGFENEPERGSRCEKCFQLRLEKTAEYAASVGADYFTTTLSVSPHKSFTQIKNAAEKAAEKYGVKYLEMDFKKKNGFLRTNEIARSYNFYRQTYCGCKFSMRG